MICRRLIPVSHGVLAQGGRPSGAMAERSIPYVCTSLGGDSVEEAHSISFLAPSVSRNPKCVAPTIEPRDSGRPTARHGRPSSSQAWRLYRRSQRVRRCVLQSAPPNARCLETMSPLLRRRRSLPCRAQPRCSHGDAAGARPWRDAPGFSTKRTGTPPCWQYRPAGSPTLFLSAIPPGGAT